MAEAKEAKLKEVREKRVRQKDQNVIKEDLASDKKTEMQVKEIKREVAEIKKIVEDEHKNRG